MSVVFAERCDVDPAACVASLRSVLRSDVVAEPEQNGPAGFAIHLGRRQGRKIHANGSVIVTQMEWEGREWVHTSIARIGRMPSYDDLAALHKAVFGSERYSYQVFAPSERHISIHPFALHLWGCMEGDGRVLPDFGFAGTI